jgi:hypothetical protein
VMRPLQETQSPFCLTSTILSMRFIFSLGLMVNGRTRLPIINEHTNEICYTLTWTKYIIKFELIETNRISSPYVVGIILHNKIHVSSMKSQILMAIGIAIVASVLVTGLASSIYAQSNMTGGNMTGGNMTGGNTTIIDTMSDGGGDGDDDGSGEGDESGGGDDNDDQSGEGGENN